MFETLALQQLGKLVSPITGKVERDLRQARITIDMLVMIREKTAGNLSAGRAENPRRRSHGASDELLDESKRAKEGAAGGEARKENGTEHEQLEIDSIRILTQEGTV